LLLHLERHQVLARDDADDVVVNVDDHEVSKSERSEDDVRSIQRVVFVDLRHRDVEKRFLFKFTCTDTRRLEINQQTNAKMFITGRRFNAKLAGFNQKTYSDISENCPQNNLFILQFIAFQIV